MPHVFSVAAAGDVVLSGPLHRPVKEEPLYDQLNDADSSFINLEMPFSRNGSPSEKLIAIKADPDHASILRDLNIDVITVANNHGMDYGVDGLRETLRTLDHIGVAHVGGGSNVVESFKPWVKEVRGTKVAYIGVATTLPNGSGAGRSRAGLAGVRVFTKYVVDPVTLDETPGMAPYIETQTYQPDQDVLLQTIKDARAHADIVLVAIHWGVPYGWLPKTQNELATYQQPLAHAMIDAGASAIFGHHPHVVQGVEMYNGAPVFYSLGNFIFSNDIVTPDDSFRTYPPYDWTSLQLTLSNIGALAKVAWSEGKVSQCALVPMTLGATGEPTHATPGDAETLTTRLRALSRGFGVSFDLESVDKGYRIIVSKS